MFGHERLIADKARISAFRKAIFKAVKSGDVVLDIGTGTGILAFFAIQAGAKRVYAVERDKKMIYIAKRLARENNLNKKIIFIQGDYFKIKLPRKVDVVVSEVIGNMVFDEGILRIFKDAKKRFSTATTKFIPSQIKVMAVPAKIKKIYEDEIFLGRYIFGVDFSSTRDFSMNKVWILAEGAKAFMCKPKEMADIDLSKIDSCNVNIGCVFQVKRSNIMDGFIMYFKARLFDDIWLTNVPDDKKIGCFWCQAFLPLQHHIRVKSNDSIKIQMHVFWTKRLGYIYNWHTEFYRRRKCYRQFARSTILNSYPFLKDRQRLN